MVHQFDQAREVSELLGWKNYGKKGIEADDFIGSFTKKWPDEADYTIITGDKDMLQLLNPSVKIAFMKKAFISMIFIPMHGSGKSMASCQSSSPM